MVPINLVEELQFHWLLLLYLTVVYVLVLHWYTQHSALILFNLLEEL